MLTALALSLAPKAGNGSAAQLRRASFARALYSAMAELPSLEHARLMHQTLAHLPPTDAHRSLLFEDAAPAQSKASYQPLDILPHGDIAPWPNNFVHVEIIGEFAYSSLSRHIAAIQQASGVDLVLNSLGGSARLALELYRALSAHSHSSGTVIGCACSAAAFTLLGCKHRRIARNAHIMLHTVTCSVCGTAAELRREAESTAEFQRACGEILLRVSPELAAICFDGKDHYFNATQSLHYGLVHEIIDAPLVDRLGEVYGVPPPDPGDPDATAITVLIEVISRLRPKFTDERAFQGVLDAFTHRPLFETPQAREVLAFCRSAVPPIS
jgi:ATP-dependent protease ClpP protease subunit